MSKKTNEEIKKALRERKQLRDKPGVPLMTPNEFQLSKDIFLIKERLNELETNNKLMQYLYWNFRYGKLTEFRIAIKEDGSAYIHPLGKDGDTLDFTIKGLDLV